MFRLEILRVYPERERQTRQGWENQLFSSLKRQYLENGSRILAIQPKLLWQIVWWKCI